MYTTIIDNTPQHEDYDTYVPCIHCDWSAHYEDEVKAEAIKFMQEWNAVNPDDQIMDWKEFVTEAVDKISCFPFVKTTCDNCY